MRAAKSKNDSIIRELNGFDRQEKKDLTDQDWNNFSSFEAQRRNF